MKTSGAMKQQNVTASESGQSFFTAESTNVNVANVAPGDENGQTVAVKVTVTN